MKGFATKAIHGGLNKTEAYGALRTPVYDTVAFEHESARSIQLAFEGKSPDHVYSRISNPTVQDFEQKIRQISGGTAVLAVASGHHQFLSHHAIRPDRLHASEPIHI